MKTKHYFIPILLVFSLPLISQDYSGFGVIEPDRSVPCVTAEEHHAIELELKKSMDELSQRGILPEIKDRTYTTMLAWPLEQNNELDDYGYHSLVSFVDHDLDYPGMLLDYNCGTRTYDRDNGYNHSGTDMRLWPFSWYKMDNDHVKVVAAAPGIIVYKKDGEFDRSCSFNSGGLGNAIYVRHADGSVAWYGHMKNGSVTDKSVGESVVTGEYLGIVGSSGNSQGPHLHFEVRDASNSVIDPYDGECNSFNSQSWWIDQRPYYDSGLNALRTHDAPPVFNPCPETETTNEKNQFCSGEVVYYAGYYRDQLIGQQLEYKIFQPDNTIYQQWEQTFDVNYSYSYWYWSYTLPALPMTGKWKFQVTYEGEVYEKFFDVMGLTDISVDDSSSFCEGDSVIINAPESQYGFTYQWTKNHIDIPGATSSTFVTTEEGEYRCEVSIPNGCWTISNPIMVEFLSTPIVDLGEEILYVEGEEAALEAGGVGLTYLWSTGEETSSIIVDTSGIYGVTVTDGNGCTASDEVEVVFIMTSIEDELSDRITIFPNPVEDYLYIRSESLPIGVVKLVDVMGRVVKEVVGNDLVNGICEIYLGTVSTGMYFIIIENSIYRKNVGVVVMR